MDETNIASIRRYLDEIRTKSARQFDIREDEVHMGHALLTVFGEHPEFIAQIDAITGESETFSSIQGKIIKLAISLKKAGVKNGDLLLLYIPNGLQTCLAFYVGYIGGFPILPIDPSTLLGEVKHYVAMSNPKVIFCTIDNKKYVDEVIETNNIDPIVIVIDNHENNIEKFIERYGASEDRNGYKPPVLDMSAPAWLLPTSGTTGKSKVAVMTHRNTWFNLSYFNFILRKFPKPTKYAFLVSTPQWLTAVSLYCSSAILVFTRIQTAEPLTSDLCKTIIERWRPTYLVVSPTKLGELFNAGCDFSKFETLLVGGSAFNVKVEKAIKEANPDLLYVAAYGMTELLGISLLPGVRGPLLNLGKEMSSGFKYRLVDAATREIITKPNVQGELLIKSDCEFGGYYNCPEETANIYNEDGFLKTGDLVYKDEEGYYFFVERLKMLLKYMNYHVYPTEIEEVLRRHPAVADAAVTGISDERGDLPVGLVIVKEGLTVAAKELRELVAEQLSDPKQLRGGVVFVDKFPLTPSHKLNRSKLREVVRNSEIEF